MTLHAFARSISLVEKIRPPHPFACRSDASVNSGAWCLAAGDLHDGLAAAEGKAECCSGIAPVDPVGLCRRCFPFVSLLNERTQLDGGVHRYANQIGLTATCWPLPLPGLGSLRLLLILIFYRIHTHTQHNTTQHNTTHHNNKKQYCQIRI